MTGENITRLLSTPRELCKNCYNWLTQYDVGDYDLPHCVENAFDTNAYLIGNCNTCSKHTVL